MLDHQSVQQANEDDVRVILGWLEREYREDGEGFWSNRRKISRSFEEGDLWVIRKDGGAIAFQIGDYGTDVVCVRKDHRRQGYGTALFEFSLTQAIRDNVNVLAGECLTGDSFLFWEKMGFEPYGGGAPITVRRVLHRDHEISADLPRIEVTVSFYPEAVVYSSGVSPLRVHHLTAGRLKNGCIRLPYRVVGMVDDEKPSKDLVVRIVVDGGELCFCKAKYDEAKAIGVRYDGKGHSFYIDEIIPVKDTQETTCQDPAA